MQKTSIAYDQTGYFSKLITDYLIGDAFLSNFYNYKIDINAFEKIIAEKQAEHIDRHNLTQTLLAQYKNIQCHKAVQDNIIAFSDEHTFCIVTAHQLNIFTGPLYVIYKTISTINACKILQKKYPAYHFVPVFWLGSEDHDFAEINHFNIFNKTLSWQKDATGAVGRLDTKGLEPLLQELQIILGGSDAATYLHTTFSDAYLQSTNLTQAVTNYMHVLFGAEGLVVVNGDDVRLKKTCTDIIKDELLYKQSFRIVNKTSSRLAERYKLQAHPREINLFFIEENVRERITFNANTKEYAVVNTNMRFGQEEMMEIAASKPEKLSPNVILRPLFQQRVLPSLAYVGGGGELSYWLQLKELFTTYHTAFPMLLLRNSALLIDKQVSERMQKLNLSVQDIFADENTLVKHYLQRNAAAELSLAVQKQEIEKLFNTIVQQSNRIDPSLEKTVLAEKQSVFNSLDKLEAKLLKAEKQKADVTIQQIKNIKNKLFPSGELQERNNNFMQYYVQMGAGFFEVLYKNLNPFDVTFSVLSDTP